MALINPSNLYRGNAVVLDTQPFANTAMQLMAKQQAKRDAMDRYYQKVIEDTQTYANKMRPQELNNGWTDDYNKLQEMAMNPQIKKYLENPSKYGQEGFNAINNFNQLHSSLMTRANASRAMIPQMKQALDLFYLHHQNPTDNDFKVIRSMEAPIGSPESMIETPDPVTGIMTKRPASIDDLSPNIPPLKQGDITAAYKNALGSHKPIPSVDNGVFDPKTGFTKFTTTYALQPDVIKDASANYANSLLRSRSGMNTYQKLVEDPASADNLNAAYQSVFGAKDANGNPNVVRTPFQAAQAEFINKAKGDLSQLTSFKETPATRDRYATGQQYLKNSLIKGRQQSSGNQPTPPKDTFSEIGTVQPVDMRSKINFTTDSKGNSLGVPIHNVILFNKMSSDAQNAVLGAIKTSHPKQTSSNTYLKVNPSDPSKYDVYSTRDDTHPLTTVDANSVNAVSNKPLGVKEVRLSQKPQNTQSNKAIELSGKVDPKQLRIGQDYSVNGRMYIWNGKKLKAK